MRDGRRDNRDISVVLIDDRGVVRFVWHDDLVDLVNLGHAEIVRASHVEPDSNTPGQWTADLRISGGPFLCGFNSRASAIAAEVAWLNQHLAMEVAA